ncbi:MAG: signal recognition particle receptor subunit alpha, partial [Castellaniella sp.]
MPAQSGIPGAPEVQDAPEVAPVAPTELPPGATASGAVVPDAVPPEMPLRAAEPVSEFTDGAGPAPAGMLTQPPDAWSDRPDETSDPLARLDRSVKEPASPESASTGSWLGRLRRGLSRTGQSLGGLFSGVKVDETLFEELETALIMADAGVEATEKLLAELRARVRRQRI